VRAKGKITQQIFLGGDRLPKKPTVDEARLILELYDLRREPELRKARQWWLTTFWPKDADDFMKVAMDFGSQENNWLRQAGSYWGIATSFVLNGVVSEKLFFEPAFCGELYFMLRKCGLFSKNSAKKQKTLIYFYCPKRPSWDRSWGARNSQGGNHAWR